jgi:chemotaxis protein CheD
LHPLYSQSLKRTVLVLKPGDYHATAKGEVLYTVVGSCIAACIYDTQKTIGGMNHFMLPGLIHPDEMLTSELGRYGMFAMELLVGELIKLGAKRKDLQAKLFGGGHVLKFRQRDGDITGSNIQFARKYLELEGIPIVKQDLGGTVARKVLFFSDSFRVLMKRIEVRVSDRLLQEEQVYRSKVFEKPSEPQAVFMFEQMVVANRSERLEHHDQSADSEGWPGETANREDSSQG